MATDNGQLNFLLDIAKGSGSSPDPNNYYRTILYLREPLALPERDRLTGTDFTVDFFIVAEPVALFPLLLADLEPVDQELS